MPFYHVDMKAGMATAHQTIEAESRRKAEILGRMWWELAHPQTDEPIVNIHLATDQRRRNHVET